MKYIPIKNSFYIQNRKKLLSKIENNSLIILHSNYTYPKNADLTFKFEQNPDLFYLTGIDQEETILVLSKGAKDQSLKELLFIKESSKQIKVVEGDKLTKKEASKLSGIKEENIYFTRSFNKYLKLLMTLATNIYLATNEHTRNTSPIKDKNHQFALQLKDQYPLHTYKRLTPIITKLREVKDKKEIQQIKKAIDITNKAFKEIKKRVKPGIKEQEIEAIIMYEFIKNGATTSFNSIVASGIRTCTLHYDKNENICKKGDLLLIDFGAKYGNYTSDITRVIPISGKFTKRQKEVYNSVLNIQKSAIKLIKPGVKIKDYYEKVNKIAEKELLKLKLITKQDIKSQTKDSPAYKTYFLHSISHFLGLDVHDVGSYYQSFKKGMVLTVEPGIYIPEEKIGIRIEDDILIKDNGVEVLSKDIEK